MKAAPMTARPSFPLMKQGDIQNIYHLQMPRWLFTDPRYMGLALESKVAYTFLLNRFQLSRLNGWVNEDGAVFIIYTRRSLAEETQVSYRKIIEAMKELSAAGLIWEKRCGRGDANQIYLALVDHGQPKGGSAPFVDPEHEAAGGDPEPEGAESVRSAESALLGQEQAGDGVSLSAVEVPEQHFKKCWDGTSASAELELPEVPERHPNYTDKSHTDLSHTDVSPSVPRRRGTADGEEELAGILDACELPCFSRETARVFENAIERLYYSVRHSSAVAQLLVGPQHIHHGLGHVLHHAQLIVVAAVHHLLDIPLHLRAGVDHTVIEQVVHGHGKGIRDAEQAVEADIGTARLNIADVGGGHPRDRGKLVLFHVGLDPGDLDPFA